MMPFAPLHGYLINGPQSDQGKWQGWRVHAIKSKKPVTSVVILTKKDFDALSEKAWMYDDLANS